MSDEKQNIDKTSDLLGVEDKEKIAKKILAEEKNNYHSKMFSKIEKQVKESLVNQKTDDALKDITL